MNKPGAGLSNILPEMKKDTGKKKRMEVTGQGMRRSPVFCLSCIFLILIGFAILPSGAAAEYTEVESVTRNIPAEFSAGEPIEVTLSINGKLPLAVGIVEIIPEGFQFPETDGDVSDAEYFRLDRENGKIAFSVLNVTEIKYTVIASSTDEKNSFEGQWVDLLVQTQALDEGKERWKTVIDSNSAVPDMESRAADASGEDDTEESESSVSAPGYGLVTGLIALISCLFVSGSLGLNWEKGGRKK